MELFADVAMLSRIQFAATVAYHFFFVPLSIGLGLILAINETRYYRSRNEKDAAATRFWAVSYTHLVRSVYDIQTVTLSGGVFMNRYLLEHALPALESAGFTAAVNRDLPPNDGCISFGQAVVAWARNEANEAPCEDPSA